MKISKKEFLYLFLMGSAALFGIIRTIAYGAYLSPANMGYYSIAITIASYGTFLQLGLMSGLNRELPVSLGKGKQEYSSDLVGETTIAVISLQLIGIIVYYIIIANITFKDSFIRNAFFYAGLLAFSAPFGQMVMLRLRAEQRVLSFSSLRLINTLGITLLGILAIQYMSYKGAILAIVLINFASFIIVGKTILNPANYFYFKLKDIIYLIRIGLPMMAAGVLLNLQMSMDRLFLVKNVSATELGIYQIGTLPLTMGIVISSIANQYVGPKLLFRYGQGESFKYVFNKSLMVSLIIIGSMFLFWPIVPPLADFVINRWLPDYHRSLPLISIFYLGAIFTSANITGVAILAANRQILSLYQTAFMAFICFIGYLLISHYNMTIKWYAYVNVAVQIIGFFMVTGISYYLSKQTSSRLGLRILGGSPRRDKIGR